MRRMMIVAAMSLLMSAVSPAVADTVTFRQYLQKVPSARLIRYANHDAGAVKAAEIYTTPTASSTAHGSIPVLFVLSAVGLPADLVGMQDAHLTLDFFSNSGTTGTGAERVQAFNSGTISIVRDVAAAEGLGSRTNLLTVTLPMPNWTRPRMQAHSRSRATPVRQLPIRRTSWISRTS